MSFPNAGDLVQAWDWNLPLELAVWFIVLLIAFAVWFWTKSGVYRKNTPDILGRNVEDFAGVTQESNGPIPIFLLLLYLVVGLFLVGYPVITLIFGYKY